MMPIQGMYQVTPSELVLIEPTHMMVLQASEATDEPLQYHLAL